MTINKSLGTILYALFGPNGANQAISITSKRDYAIFAELQRHGIVRLIPTDETGFNGIFNVVRAIGQK